MRVRTGFRYTLAITMLWLASCAAGVPSASTPGPNQGNICVGGDYFACVDAGTPTMLQSPPERLLSNAGPNWPGRLRGGAGALTYAYLLGAETPATNYSAQATMGGFYDANGGARTTGVALRMQSNNETMDYGPYIGFAVDEINGLAYFSHVTNAANNPKRFGSQVLAVGPTLPYDKASDLVVEVRVLNNDMHGYINGQRTLSILDVPSKLGSFTNGSIGLWTGRGSPNPEGEYFLNVAARHITAANVTQPSVATAAQNININLGGNTFDDAVFFPWQWSESNPSKTLCYKDSLGPQANAILVGDPVYRHVDVETQIAGFPCQGGSATDRQSGIVGVRMKWNPETNTGSGFGCFYERDDGSDEGLVHLINLATGKVKGSATLPSQFDMDIKVIAKGTLLMCLFSPGAGTYKLALAVDVSAEVDPNLVGHAGLVAYNSTSIALKSRIDVREISNEEIGVSNFTRDNVMFRFISAGRPLTSKFQIEPFFVEGQYSINYGAQRFVLQANSAIMFGDDYTPDSYAVYAEFDDTKTKLLRIVTRFNPVTKHHLGVEINVLANIIYFVLYGPGGKSTKFNAVQYHGLQALELVSNPDRLELRGRLGGGAWRLFTTMEIPKDLGGATLGTLVGFANRYNPLGEATTSTDTVEIEKVAITTAPSYAMNNGREANLYTSDFSNPDRKDAWRFNPEESAYAWEALNTPPRLQNKVGQFSCASFGDPQWDLSVGWRVVLQSNWDELAMLFQSSNGCYGEGNLLRISNLNGGQVSIGTWTNTSSSEFNMTSDASAATSILQSSTSSLSLVVKMEQTTLQVYVIDGGNSRLVTEVDVNNTSLYRTGNVGFVFPRASGTVVSSFTATLGGPSVGNVVAKKTMLLDYDQFASVDRKKLFWHPVPMPTAVPDPVVGTNQTLTVYKVFTRGSGTWTSYTVHMDIHEMEQGVVLLRSSFQCSKGVGIVLDRSNNSITAAYVDPVLKTAVALPNIPAVAIPASLGTSFHLAVAVHNNELYGFFNGELLVQGTDNLVAAQSSGPVCLGPSTNRAFRFSNYTAVCGYLSFQLGVNTINASAGVDFDVDVLILGSECDYVTSDYELVWDVYGAPVAQMGTEKSVGGNVQRIEAMRFNQLGDYSLGVRLVYKTDPSVYMPVAQQNMTIRVQPGPPSKDTVLVTEAQNPITAGDVFAVQVRLRDEFNHEIVNPAPEFQQIEVVNANNQVIVFNLTYHAENGTFSGSTDQTFQAANRTLKLRYGVGGGDASNTFKLTVNPKPTVQRLTVQAPTQAEAGTAFQVQMTPKDEYGNDNKDGSASVVCTVRGVNTTASFVGEKYRCALTETVAGQTQVFAYVYSPQGVVIVGSPRTVEVSSKTPVAALSRVVDPFVVGNVRVSQPYNFTVELRDEFNNTVQGQTASALATLVSNSLAISSNASGTAGTLVPVEGRQDLVIVPFEFGSTPVASLQMSIKWDGVHVKNSPFVIKLLPGTTRGYTLSGSALQTFKAGETRSVNVTSVDGFGNRATGTGDMWSVRLHSAVHETGLFNATALEEGLYMTSVTTNRSAEYEFRLLLDGVEPPGYVGQQTYRVLVLGGFSVSGTGLQSSVAGVLGRFTIHNVDAFDNVRYVNPNWEAWLEQGGTVVNVTIVEAGYGGVQHYYNATYNATRAGKYSVHLKVNGSYAEGFPYGQEEGPAVLAAGADAQSSGALVGSAALADVTAGESLVIDVLARDAFGNNVTTGGAGLFAAKAYVEATGALVLEANSTQVSGAVHRVSMTLTLAAERLRIHVRLGEQMTGAPNPLNVTVVPGPISGEHSRLVNETSGANKWVAGRLERYRVELRDVYNNTALETQPLPGVNISATGGVANGTTSWVRDGSELVVRISATRSGPYTVDVRLGGTSVIGAPFSATTYALTRPHAPLCYVDMMQATYVVGANSYVYARLNLEDEFGNNLEVDPSPWVNITMQSRKASDNSSVYTDVCCGPGSMARYMTQGKFNYTLPTGTKAINYTLTMSLDGVAIGSGPSFVHLVPGDVDLRASRVFVNPGGSQYVAGTVIEDVAAFADVYGNLRNSATEDMELVMTGPVNVSVASTRRWENWQLTSRVFRYNLTVAGTYVARVVAGGSEIDQGPYNFTIAPGPRSAAHTLVRPLHPLTMRVNLRQRVQLVQRDSYLNAIALSPAEYSPADFALPQSLAASGIRLNNFTGNATLFTALVDYTANVVNKTVAFEVLGVTTMSQYTVSIEVGYAYPHADTLEVTGTTNAGESVRIGVTLRDYFGNTIVTPLAVVDGEVKVVGNMSIEVAKVGSGNVVTVPYVLKNGRHFNATQQVNETGTYTVRVLGAKVSVLASIFEDVGLPTEAIGSKSVSVLAAQVGFPSVLAYSPGFEVPARAGVGMYFDLDVRDVFGNPRETQSGAKFPQNTGFKFVLRRTTAPVATIGQVELDDTVVFKTLNTTGGRYVYTHRVNMTVAGTYSLEIEGHDFGVSAGGGANYKHVVNSPLTFVVQPNAVDVRRSKVQHSENVFEFTAVAGFVEQRVTLNDGFGNGLDTSQPEFTALVNGSANGTAVYSSVKDGHVTLQYTLTRAGSYVVHARFANMDLGNSPMTVRVSPGALTVVNTAVKRLPAATDLVASDVHTAVLTVEGRDQYNNTRAAVSGEYGEGNGVMLDTGVVGKVAALDTEYKLTMNDGPGGKGGVDVDVLSIKVSIMEGKYTVLMWTKRANAAGDVLTVVVNGVPKADERVTSVPAALHVASCEVSSRPTFIVAGENGTLRLEARDRFANVISEGGSGPALYVNTSRAWMYDAGNGTYVYTTRQTKMGGYVVNFTGSAGQEKVLAQMLFVVPARAYAGTSNVTVIGSNTKRVSEADGAQEQSVIVAVSLYDEFGNPRVLEWENDAEKIWLGHTGEALAPWKFRRVSGSSHVYTAMLNSTVAGWREVRVYSYADGNATVGGSGVWIWLKPGAVVPQRSVVSKPTVVRAGEDVTMVVQARDRFLNNATSGGEPFDATFGRVVAGVLSTSFLPPVVDQHDGRYVCHTNFTQAGTYTIAIKGSDNRDVVLTGGDVLEVLPVEVTTAAKSVLGVMGPEFYNADRERQWVNVTMRDVYGNARTRGGEVLDVGVERVGSGIVGRTVGGVGAEVSAWNVTDHGNGRYGVWFATRVAGVYNVTVLLGGHALGGADVSVWVRSGAAVATKTLAWGDGLNVTQLQEQFATVFLQARDAHDNHIDHSALSFRGRLTERVANAPRLVAAEDPSPEPEPGRFRLRYKSPYAGEFALQVLYFVGDASTNIFGAEQVVRVLANCPLGQARPSEFACEPCVRGTYASVANELACVTCPDPASQTSPSEARSVLDCVCKEQYYDRSATGCKACPAGATCAGLDARPIARAGFWASPENPDQFLKCANPEACPGGGQLTCATGYTGRLCAECETRFYKLSGKCEPCPDNSNWIVALMAMALVVFCVGLRSYGQKSRSYSMMGIAMNNMQLMALFSGFSLNWPREVLWVFNVFSLFVFNVELTSPECALPLTYWSKWYAKLALPVVVVGLLMVTQVAVYLYELAAIRRFKKRREMYPEEAHDPESVYRGVNGLVLMPREDLSAEENVNRGRKEVWRDAMNITWNAMLVFLGLSYALVVPAALEVFVCSDDGGGGLVLDAAPTIMCYEEEWLGRVWVAVLAGVGYGLGIPAFLYWELYKLSSALQTPYAEVRAGSLYMPFNPSKWYWSLTGLIRKLSVVLSRVVLRQPILQATVAFAVLLASLELQIFHKPYKRAHENSMEVAALSSTLLLVLTGLLFLSDKFASSTVDQNTAITVITTFAVTAMVFNLVAVAVSIFHSATAKRAQIVTASNAKTLQLRLRKIEANRRLAIEMQDLSSPETAQLGSGVDDASRESSESTSSNTTDAVVPSATVQAKDSKGTVKLNPEAIRVLAQASTIYSDGAAGRTKKKKTDDEGASDKYARRGLGSKARQTMSPAMMVRKQNQAVAASVVLQTTSLTPSKLEKIKRLLNGEEVDEQRVGLMADHNGLTVDTDASGTDKPTKSTTPLRSPLSKLTNLFTRTDAGDGGKKEKHTEEFVRKGPAGVEMVEIVPLDDEDDDEKEGEDEEEMSTMVPTLVVEEVVDGTGEEDSSEEATDSDDPEGLPPPPPEHVGLSDSDMSDEEEPPPPPVEEA